jgi:hypothetical protein
MDALFLTNPTSIAETTLTKTVMCTSADDVNDPQVVFYDKNSYRKLASNVWYMNRCL